MKRSRDTSSSAQQRQFEAFREMTPEHRLRLAMEMTEDIRRLAEAGIRDRHPEYSSQEVDAAFAEMMLGPVMARSARTARRLIK